MRRALLAALGLQAEASSHQSRLVATIHERLQHLPEARAELVAAFAGLLVRVAHADHEISAAEAAMLRTLVREHAGLKQREADDVVAILTAHVTALAGINYAALTRIFNRRASMREKEHLIDCLYAVAGAGSLVTVVEDEEIRAVARALLLAHSQVIDIRSRHREHLEVLRGLRRGA